MPLKYLAYKSPALSRQATVLKKLEFGLAEFPINPARGLVIPEIFSADAVSEVPEKAPLKMVVAPETSIAT